MKIVMIVVAILALTGCADSAELETAIEMEKVGFLYGAWHGVTLPISFFGQLMFDDIAIYAIYNNGGWYDFGYSFGACCLGISSRSENS
tara:strand:- start:1591 stop:1857 length:267 start_codon:yes stop_codon:yes gene_type:complete